MIRKFSQIFLISILVTTATQATLTSSKQQALAGKLRQLTKAYKTKVGITFIDLKTGWQFNLNGSKEFPAASVVKVAVMTCAYHLAESGKLDLEEKIKFKESDKVGGAGVLRWMKAGNFHTIRNLIRLMIVLSDNTATKILVDHLGPPTINEYLRSMGLFSTRIADSTMLKEPPEANINISTPSDTAQLFLKIAKAEGFSIPSQKETLTLMRNQRYRWGIPRGLPARIIVANKTGHLEGILNDAGIIYTNQGTYVLAIFTQDFKRLREARLLINEISRITYEEYTGEKVTKPRSRRRPSGKYQRRWGRRGGVSSRKLRTYLRR